MINRDLFEDLKNHIPKKELSLIVGPRQAGKTTLMLLLKDYLVKKGESTLFLSLDFDSDQPHFTSQSSLLGKIELELGRDRGYVFIDEIQRKENAGLFLKGLYDMNLPYKFIVSGSGSLELKEKIHESLAGRKRIFQLNTLSFAEFAQFKTGYRYGASLRDFFTIESLKTGELLEQYLNFGGYPRVVLETELIEKSRIIDEIYRSYLERDISYLLRIEKTEAFSSLVKVLASQTGRMINYSELSATLGISVQTVKNYIWYAEKTFILQRVSPYFRNVRKEITKAPVIYYYDPGLRSYSIGLFGHAGASRETGFFFQNLVWRLLQEKYLFSPAEVHFWRTTDKAEVDFVITLGQRIIPVEVKYRDFKRPEIGRSLRSFIHKYQPEKAWIINLSLREITRINQTDVIFIPFWDIDTME